MLIAPTALTAYQFILTEPEVRAAIANPSLLLPHFKSALQAGKAKDPQADLRAETPAPADAKPNLRTATIRIPSNDWIAFCAELARLYPAYQDSDNQPDMFHIALTARRCGFNDVTEDNFQQVISTLIAHAQETHPAPA